MTIVHRLLVVVAVVVATASGAAAQPAAQPAPPPAGAQPAAYASPMREQCAAEIDKDAGWRADITTRFEILAHARAAQKIQRNERHVFIAYGVIWVLVAGMLGVMWMRQRKLNAEIQRLEEELRRVEQDGK